VTDPKKEKYRQIRGYILKILAHEHPRPIDYKVLHFALDDLGFTITDEECQSHLSYLVEKKLIRLEMREFGDIQIKMAIIAVEGLDLLNGFTKEKDLGIDVRF
jgi:hypothetical protein